jgi:hypothetical protein
MRSFGPRELQQSLLVKHDWLSTLAMQLLICHSIPLENGWSRGEKLYVKGMSKPPQSLTSRQVRSIIFIFYRNRHLLPLKDHPPQCVLFSSPAWSALWLQNPWKSSLCALLDIIGHVRDSSPQCWTTLNSEACPTNPWHCCLPLGCMLIL